MKLRMGTSLRAMMVTVAVGLSASIPAAEADPIRALLLTGGHPYDVTEFHRMFDTMEGIEFTHVELQNHSEVFEEVAGWEYDTVVFYNMTHELSDKRLANLVQLTEWGVGLVPLHHGTLSWTPQPFVRQQIFGVQFPEAGAFGFHIGEHFQYNITDRNHPITQQMADFDVIDESYTNYYGTGQPGNRVLVTTTHTPADPQLVWVRKLNQSRIANIQGGHDRLMFENAAFQSLIRQSVLWTAGRLPEEIGGDPLTSGSIYRNTYQVPAMIKTLAARTPNDSRRIETAIQEYLAGDSLTASQRAELLDGLLQIAAAPTSEKVARSFALRTLGDHAETRQLEAIAALLQDPIVNQMARFALEQSIQDEATVLLREALADSEGQIRRGIVFSLSRLGDEAARPLIAPMLASEDLDDVKAAATALGTIGGMESVSLLRAAHGKATGDAAALIEMGLLTASESLTDAEADTITRALKDQGATAQVRAGAWRGLLMRGTATGEDLEAGLSVEDARVRDAVVRVLPLVNIPDWNAVVAEKWSSLDRQEQLGVLYGIEQKRSDEGLTIIHDALVNQDEAVRQSAIYVAGTMGTRETASKLIGMMATAPEAERRLIGESLAALPGEGVDEVILASTREAAPETRAALITALADRAATAHVRELFASIQDEDRGVRRAAFDAVSRLGGDGEVAGLIDYVLATESTPDRREASRALIALVSDSEAKDEHLAALMAAVEGGGERASESLLPVVAALNTPEARDSLVALTRSEHEPLRLDAVRALAEWKDSSPMEALLALAIEGEGREAALASRGYIRLIQSDTTLHREERMAAAIKIQPHLKDQGAKAQLVGLASGIPTRTSLDIITSYMGDPAMQRDAVFGIVRLSEGLSADYPEEVKAALRSVIDSESVSAELRAEAQKGLDAIELYADRILANWTFTDDLHGWEALNQSRLENINGVLIIHCEGADPYISVPVEIPEQPMTIQMRVRYTDPQAFQFFFETTERPMTDPASVVNILPGPSTGDWVDFEANLQPKGTMRQFRFDPSLKEGMVEVDYIRLLKQ